MSDHRLNRSLEAAMGKFVLGALQDPNTVEIMLNPNGELWLEQHGQPMFKAAEMSAEQARRVVSLVASSLGTTITRKHPFVEGELPLDGSRFEGTDFPIVSGPSFCIRKKCNVVFPLESYVENNIITETVHTFLLEAISRRLNIIVIGGTGSGKTTLVNSLIASLAYLCPEHRIIAIEDTCEIQVSSKNFVLFRTSDDVSMQNLNKISMRYRPDRIIIGEVRDGSALDLLKAWSTGHAGGIATLHANNALDSLGRLEDLIAERVASPMQRLIGRAVDVIVNIQKTSLGRKVIEVAIVHGFDIKTKQYDISYIYKDKSTKNDGDWYKIYTE
ncbi:MAG: P-type conjugative transfer ATPase TrbB [Desulfovibrionaceae bacterium]|nr:P-type conjugative transfer ATPase TrbB [Desulfovibrionaceae bacterium]MBF0514197.1 P-type conjugative transfer ATPase TrbB [Desulfovibrionaceae bacterium]